MDDFLDFDPLIQTRFRGKGLPDLSRDELLEALVFALKRVHYLQTISDPRHAAAWPTRRLVVG